MNTLCILPAAVSSGAPQTDNSSAVVGGVIVAVVVTIAITIIVVVALLRVRCGLTAKTPVQYVLQILCSYKSVFSSSVRSPHCRESMRSVDVPTSTNETYELVKQAGWGEMGGGGIGARGGEGEEGYVYEVVPSHPPIQPVVAAECVYEHIS